MRRRFLRRPNKGPVIANDEIKTENNEEKVVEFRNRETGAQLNAIGRPSSTSSLDLRWRDTGSAACRNSMAIRLPFTDANTSGNLKDALKSKSRLGTAPGNYINCPLWTHPLTRH